MKNTKTQSNTSPAPTPKSRVEATFGQLDCDTIHAKADSVDWSDAFSWDGEGDPRAEIVYPEFEDLEDALSYLEDAGEHSTADDIRERLAGLDEEEREEFDDLKNSAGRSQEEEERFQELQRIREYNTEEPDDLLEEANEHVREMSADEWEPMMNFAYPIAGLSCSPEEAQAKLCGRPVVVVILDGEPVLALSGGGMDFSWEICEAYCRLGMRPPLEFCRLPRMAGRGESERDRAIIAACYESATIAESWAKMEADRLAEMMGGK